MELIIILSVVAIPLLLALLGLGAYLWLIRCCKKQPPPHSTPPPPPPRHYTPPPVPPPTVINFSHARKLAVETEIRAIQWELVQKTRFMGPPSSTTLGAEVIIGVDATPTRIGGYLLNMKERSVEFYSFPTEKLPWMLTPTQSNRGWSAEFEMKNLHFALLLWEQVILQEREQSVRVYTDNMEFEFTDTVYGQRVRTYVYHLNNCMGGKIQVSVRGAIPKWVVDHSMFIKPADDFSRKKFQAAKTFLRGYFGIEEHHIHGSHREDLEEGNENNGNNGRYFRCDKYYTELLRKVKSGHLQFLSTVCKNQKCKIGLFTKPSPSLQSIVSAII